MAQNVSDYLVERLHNWGVRTIYGYPGDGINGVTGALERADGAIRFIQTRHEETAAFAACASAKFTNGLGVCLATSGPGAIHLLNGLYDARLDHAPVLAIVGQQARTALGAEYQQEVPMPFIQRSYSQLSLSSATRVTRWTSRASVCVAVAP
jgi:pyruvate dehydrogenase (quinone)